MGSELPYKIEGERIIFQNKELIFYTDISDSIYLLNLYAVIILLSWGPESNRNVYSIDILTGKIIWQIQNDTAGYYRCPIGEIKYKENILFARTTCSFYFKINPQTGEILEKVFTQDK